MNQSETNLDNDNKFRRSWSLTKSAYQVLKLDRELLSLPLIGILMTVSIMLLASAVAIFAAFQIGHFGQPGTTYQSDQFGPFGLVGGLILITLVTFVTNFINGALMHAAIQRFEGHDPTIKSALAAARAKIKPLFLFSLVVSIIGLLIQLIIEKLPLGGKIVAWLGDLAFQVATFFALPFIMTSEEDLGPIQATRKSIDLLKKVWGESLIIVAGIGIISTLIMITYIALIVGLMIFISSLGTALPVLIVGIGGFIGMFGLAVFFSALSTIVKAAVFYFAVNQKSPQGFNKVMLKALIRPKTAKKIFA